MHPVQAFPSALKKRADMRRQTRSEQAIETPTNLQPIAWSGSFSSHSHG